MTTITATVGGRLRAHRQRLGMAREELAEKADLHPTYIGQVERGEKNLTLVSLEKILNAMDLTFSEFFEHIEAERHSSNLAARCYELVNRKSQREQEHIYRILYEIEQLVE